MIHLYRSCDINTNANQRLNTISKELEPCMNVEEVTLVKGIQNNATTLLDFMCQKDGERIIQSINGLTCIKSNEQNIKQCVKLQKYFDLNMWNSTDEINYCK